MSTERIAAKRLPVDAKSETGLFRMAMEDLSWCIRARLYMGRTDQNTYRMKAIRCPMLTGQKTPGALRTPAIAANVSTFAVHCCWS